MNMHCRKRGNSLYVCLSCDKEELVISMGIKIADEHWDKRKKKILQKSGPGYIKTPLLPEKEDVTFQD